MIIDVLKKHKANKMAENIEAKRIESNKEFILRELEQQKRIRIQENKRRIELCEKGIIL